MESAICCHVLHRKTLKPAHEYLFHLFKFCRVTVICSDKLVGKGEHAASSTLYYIL